MTDSLCPVSHHARSPLYSIAFTPTAIKIKQTLLPQGITHEQPYTSSKGECFVVDCVLIEWTTTSTCIWSGQSSGQSVSSFVNRFLMVALLRSVSPYAEVTGLFILYI